MTGKADSDLSRPSVRPTFRERVALNLRDLDGEGPAEGGPAGHHGQNYRVVVVQPHVNVHCAGGRLGGTGGQIQGVPHKKGEVQTGGYIFSYFLI